MTPQHASLSHHAAPYRDEVTLWECAFGLLGGPGAWFVQLCAGYVLAAWPCFPTDALLRAPLPDYAWSKTALGLVSLAAVLVALAALLVSRGIYRHTRAEVQGDNAHLLAGRTRFLAVWGMAAGGGFAIAAALTGVAFFILPRCGG